MAAFFCKLSNSGDPLKLHRANQEDLGTDLALQIDPLRTTSLLQAATELVMQDHRLPKRQLLVTCVPHPSGTGSSSVEMLQDDLEIVRADTLDVIDRMMIDQAMLEQYQAARDGLTETGATGALSTMITSVDELRNAISETVVSVPPSELDRVTRHLQEQPEQPFIPLNVVPDFDLPPARQALFVAAGVIDSSSSSSDSEGAEGDDAESPNADSPDEADDQDAAAGPPAVT